MALIKTAQETIRITKQGWYEKDGRRIPLVSPASGAFEDAVVFDPDKLTHFQSEHDKSFSHSARAPHGCRLCLLDAEPFEASQELDHPLVMNSANAVTPGGGFLYGGGAHEDSLCRASTLYASMTSEAAMQMYQHNRSQASPANFDYMLLSPSVCVFRDSGGRLLDSPYPVSVFSVPAPNKHGLARLVAQDELDRLMTDRLRKFFCAAVGHGFRNLVLGAWGCGAFGHDARTVAGYFRELLFAEGFSGCFDTVIFAIPHDKSRLDAFADVFGGKIEDLRPAFGQGAAPVQDSYYQASTNFPSCNHSVGITKKNLGFAQAITAGGMPFEAELWTAGDALFLSVVMPDLQIAAPMDRPKALPASGNVIGIHSSVKRGSCSALCTGMVNRGSEYNVENILQYSQWMEGAGIVAFPTAERTVAVLYATDENGTDLARVTILLQFNGNTCASTPMEFRKFTGGGGQEGKVIPFHSDL